MEEKNNSKQLVLSIIGIAVLLIAVVGVSFAFFSYSKTGSSNNVISTGEISMAFQEQNAILLTNQFPTLSSASVVAGNDDVASMNFSVTGYYSATSGSLGYTIYAIDGGAGTGTHTNRLQDSEVSVKLTPTAGTPTNNAASSDIQVSELTSDTNGKILATASIASGTDSNHPETDSYTLYMFVNDTVRISDTATTVPFTGATLAEAAGAPTKYCASARVMSAGNYVSGCKISSTGTLLADTATGATLPVYNTMYYSLKLKVVSNQ